MKIKKGGIFLANLDPVVGSEISKTRPVVIVSNDINNELAATVTVVPLTSQKMEHIFPFEICIENVLPQKSKAKANQIRTIDKKRLVKFMGKLNLTDIKRLNRAIEIHLDL